MVFAHVGHWAVQLLYLAPLAVFLGLLARAKLIERRDRRTGGPDTVAGDE
jgi:hypothetical protein